VYKSYSAQNDVLLPQVTPRVANSNNSNLNSCSRQIDPPPSYPRGAASSYGVKRNSERARVRTIAWSNWYLICRLLASTGAYVVVFLLSSMQSTLCIDQLPTTLIVPRCQWVCLLHLLISMPLIDCRSYRILFGCTSLY
jgi:hypothetical protein